MHQGSDALIGSKVWSGGSTNCVAFPKQGFVSQERSAAPGPAHSDASATTCVEGGPMGAVTRGSRITLGGGFQTSQPRLGSLLKS